MTDMLTTFSNASSASGDRANIGLGPIIAATGTGGDARAALVALDSAGYGAIRLKKGIVRVASNVTLATPLDIPNGALLRPASGVVITLAGGLSDTGVWQKFDLTEGGSVLFSNGSMPVAFPEWWDNSARANCLTALLAAENSGTLIVQLQAADYFIASTWKRVVSNVHLQGHGTQGAGGRASRIVVSGGTADTMQMGPDTVPEGGINSFPLSVSMDRVVLGRTVYPVAPPAGSETTAGRGLRAQYLLRAKVTNCQMDQHCIPLSVQGCVYSFFDDNSGDLTSAPTGPGNAIWYGVYLDGQLPLVSGLAGGNGSVYFNRNNFTTTVTTLTQARSWFSDGAYSDTFIDKIESSQTVYINGLGNIGGSTEKSANSNFHVGRIVIDQYLDYGLVIGGVGDYGSIIIDDFDFAPAVGALASIFVTSCSGLIDLGRRGIMQMWTSSSAIGLQVSNSNNVKCECDIVGATRPVVLQGSSGSDIYVRVRNPGEAASEAAIYCTNVTRSLIRLNATGMAGAFPYGIMLADSASQFNEINVTQIDPACVSGGSSNKLLINGAHITAPGTANNNMCEGIFT